MQELVDKATPKKAIEKYFQGTKSVEKYICPNCGSVYLTPMSKYCGQCGQHLDWSEEEENCDED